MTTTWETHKFEHYIFSLLLAVEVIMSFTFLGYVHIPPISITTAYIPIIITACLFGPAEASLAGLLFGLGSLYKTSHWKHTAECRHACAVRFSARLSISAGTQKQTKESVQAAHHNRGT